MALLVLATYVPPLTRSAPRIDGLRPGGDRRIGRHAPGLTLTATDGRTILHHTQTTTRPAAMSTDPLMTPQEVASRLNVKIRTAYDMLAPGGVLHHLRIDLGHKTIRVRHDALEAFLKQGATHAHS